jgi:putative copper resistance protein D
MIASVMAYAAGVVCASLIVGSVVISRLTSPSGDPVARAWRRRLARVGAGLAILFVASAIVAIGTDGRAWRVGSGTSGLLVATAMLHGAAVAVWLGVLTSLALLVHAASSEPAEASGSFAARAVQRASPLVLVLGAVAAAGGLILAWAGVDGSPALVGTAYGRMLLLEWVLFVPALGLMTVTVRRLPRLDGVEGNAVMRSLARMLLIATALALAIVTVTAILITLPPSAREPTMWPFPVRLAPAVMWRFPSVRDQVISGAEILVGGLLALVGAYRMKGGRPILVATAAVLLVAGAYKALAALTLDAYPTTYTRPAVAATEESIRRGHDLFAMHCAACHGPAGRGDGPGAAGLLQRPADLAASHTADHTPGDLYWWVTHGLGLAMPAFGDRLSAEESWDLVNFVRTLSATREPAPVKN